MGKLLSLVVPVYYEADCIDQFLKETKEALSGLPIRHEIVFVDDGSGDDTVARILAYAANDPAIKLVEFSYNQGKAAAATAGIRHASGDYLLYMDPDLQDPPKEIGRFLAEIQKGYDLVFGIRREKRDSLPNRVMSRIFWTTLNRFTGLQVPTGLAVMRIFNREFANRFLAYGEQNRFIEGIFMHVGMRRTTIEIEQRERFAGVSKFNFGRKMGLAFDAILDYSELPLRMAMRFGLLLSFLSLLSMAGIIILRLLRVDFPVGWSSMISAFTFAFGVQLFFIGVAAVYIGRIYRETKQRPLFSVKALTNIDAVPWPLGRPDRPVGEPTEHSGQGPGNLAGRP